VKVCEVCLQDIHDDGYGFYCSEYCMVAPREDQKRFQAGLKSGDFALYPCAECGCAIEDVYEPGASCSRCYPKVRLRTQVQLLKQALPYVPDALRATIEEELAK